MARAYLSLGSNLDPSAHLHQAIAELSERFGTIVVSPIYRMKAIGFDGPDFLNGAVTLDTDLTVFELNGWLHSLEDAHGRRRDVPRFSNRQLDIDIVFYDDLILTGPGHLQLPRPELRHAFVLKPLTDIAPDFHDPLTGKSLAQLWSEHPEFLTTASGESYQKLALSSLPAPN